MAGQRILVVGSNGLLGQKVVELLTRGTGASLTLASLEDRPVQDLLAGQYHRLDMTSKKDVRRVVAASEPEVVINCAAMTNVDACETERDLAWRINVGGVENIIDAVRKSGATVVHVSSDYIFDGRRGPYTEEDRPEPLSHYGKTKLASENALRVSGIPHVIARTMVLYGYAPQAKPNFALWLIQSLEAGKSVKIVDDQFGNPTLADDLAYGIVRAVELGRTGIYNLAGREIISRHAFALRVAAVFGFDAGLVAPVKTAQLKQAAPRPLASGLITLKAETELGYRPSPVDQGLAVLKNQLWRFGHRAADREPVPGKDAARRAPRGPRS